MPTARPGETTTRVLLVSIKQAAAILSISHSSIYHLMGTDHLTPIRVGRSVRFPVEQLERFVEARIAVDSPRTPSLS